MADEGVHRLTRRTLLNGSWGRIRDGVEIDGKGSFRRLSDCARNAEGGCSSVVVHEGMNRIVRRMMESAGIEVTKLSRVRVGPLSVAGIPRGGYRELTPGELTSLLQSLHVDRGAVAPGQPTVNAGRGGPRGSKKRTGARQVRGA